MTDDEVLHTCGRILWQLSQLSIADLDRAAHLEGLDMESQGRLITLMMLRLRLGDVQPDHVAEVKR